MRTIALRVVWGRRLAIVAFSRLGLALVR
jgi:hypothetical protein